MKRTATFHHSNLHVEMIDRGKWQTTIDFEVALHPWIWHPRGIVTVPTGFITDFASVPRLPIVYWQTGGMGHKSAVVHDYLYSLSHVPRSEADSAFLACLKAEGVGWIRRHAMFAGVRAFGWRHFSGKVTAKDGRK